MNPYPLTYQVSNQVTPQSNHHREGDTATATTILGDMLAFFEPPVKAARQGGILASNSIPLPSLGGNCTGRIDFVQKDQ